MQQMKMRGSGQPKRHRLSVWVALAATGGILMIFALGPVLHSVLYADTTVSFAIVSPAESATVSSPVKLGVTLKDTELGWPITGRDHLHVSVDGGPARAIYKNRVLNLPLSPGEHVIGVDLAGPTHASLLPPRYVRFTVH